MKNWEDLTDDERALRAMARARDHLDRIQEYTVDDLRHLGTVEPFPYFSMIADAMVVEIAARNARAGFRVIRTGCLRSLVRTVTEADKAALKVRATFRVIH